MSGQEHALPPRSAGLRGREPLTTGKRGSGRNFSENPHCGFSCLSLMLDRHVFSVNTCWSPGRWLPALLCARPGHCGTSTLFPPGRGSSALLPLQLQPLRTPGDFSCRRLSEEYLFCPSFSTPLKVLRESTGPFLPLSVCLTLCLGTLGK